MKYLSKISILLIALFSLVTCSKKDDHSMQKNIDINQDIQKISTEAPVPDSIKIIPPDLALEANIKSFSGHWFGRWGNVLASQLIVEKIDSTEATVVYSWGTHPDGLFQNGYGKYIAKVYSPGIIEFSSKSDVLGSAILIFEYDEDKNILRGFHRVEKGISKIIMKQGTL